MRLHRADGDAVIALDELFGEVQFHRLQISVIEFHRFKFSLMQVKKTRRRIL